jgi:hypothetical protein
MEAGKAIRLAALGLALAVTGCGGPYEAGDSKEEGSGGGAGYGLVSELFKETGETAAGETVTRFQTNDGKYWTERGYTAWTVWGTEGPEDFTGRKVRVSKKQGSASAGYGLVLCQGVREAEGKQVATMLTVMINNEGKYAIGKVIGGRYDSLVA